MVKQAIFAIIIHPEVNSRKKPPTYANIAIDPIITFFNNLTSHNIFLSFKTKVLCRL